MHVTGRCSCCMLPGTAYLHDLKILQSLQSLLQITTAMRGVHCVHAGRGPLSKVKCVCMCAQQCTVRHASGDSDRKEEVTWILASIARAERQKGMKYVMPS